MHAPLLPWLVLAATVIAMVGLLYSLHHARSFGRRTTFSAPTGDTGKGIRYAFVEGMMPWAKDSASHHLATYFTGVCYHLGIFSALALLATLAAGIELPHGIQSILSVVSLLGLACGVGLLIKRLFTGYLRAISKPDDYLANLLVDLFLLLAAATVYEPSVAGIFYLSAIALMLYLPLGKIRHCFFFFVSRVTFGKYFGHRGVLPHPRSGVE